MILIALFLIHKHMQDKSEHDLITNKKYKQRKPNELQALERQMEVKILKLSTATLFLFVLCGLLIVSAAADVYDDYFESVRGQLLAFYGSEVVSHAGIILGLLVGLFSIAKPLWRALQRRSRRLLRFFGVFIPTLIVIGLVFSAGRLVYWSDLGAYLMKTNITIVVTNNTDLMSNATSNLNLTSWIGILNDNVVNEFIADNRLQAQVARVVTSLDSENWRWAWLTVVLLIVVVPSAAWDFCPEKCEKLWDWFPKEKQK